MTLICVSHRYPSLHIDHDGLLKKVDIVRFVKLSDFFWSSSPWLIYVHGFMHTVGHDNFVGESQPPWLHRMVPPEMHVFHFWVGMVGHGEPFGSSDVVPYCFSLDFLIVCQGSSSTPLRVLIVLDDGCLRHSGGLSTGLYGLGSGVTRLEIDRNIMFRTDVY